MPPRSDVERDEDEAVGRTDETSSGNRTALTARCAHCGGAMVDDRLPRFHRGFGILVLILGLLLSVFMSLLLGLPMVVIGAYMGSASRSVWKCPHCGAVVDRIGT